MNGKEIHLKIEEYNDKLEVLERQSRLQFVFNPTVKAILDEITKLQEICPHSFTNGVCDYCGRAENDGN